MKKINVGILFGGKSAEHEVSLQSAKNLIEAISKKKYNPILMGITKEGQWLLNDRAHFLLNASSPKLIRLNKAGQRVALLPQSEGRVLNLSKPNFKQKIDVIFPIIHGPYGEDGTIQGLLKLANVPFVGASVLGSAVGMDKEVAKRLLKEAGISIAKFLVIRKGELPDFDSIVKKLGLPIFVKPVNLGSSVGISKVKDKSRYKNAVQKAFQYDNKVLVEEFIEGRELECSVLGNDKPIASVPGEVITRHEFYSYKAKYIDENGAVLQIPAKVSQTTSNKIKEIAIKTFKTLFCEGMARVDFFLKKDGNIIVNEINTIPGFTSISMYPRLWEASGISYQELIDRLIELAIERFKREKKLKHSY